MSSHVRFVLVMVVRPRPEVFVIYCKLKVHVCYKQDREKKLELFVRGDRFSSISGLQCPLPIAANKPPTSSWLETVPVDFSPFGKWAHLWWHLVFFDPRFLEQLCLPGKQTDHNVQILSKHLCSKYPSTFLFCPLIHWFTSFRWNSTLGNPSFYS